MRQWITATVGDLDLSDRVASWKPHDLATAHYVLDPHYEPTKASWARGAPLVSEHMSLTEAAREIAATDPYPESL